MRSGRTRFGVILFLLAVSLGWGPCFGRNDTWRVEGIPSSVKQGDVFRLRVMVDGRGAPSGRFQGGAIPFYFQETGHEYEALVGVDLECSAGIYPLQITLEEEGRANARLFSIEVTEAFFGVQRITLPPAMVHLDEQSLKRVRAERRRMEAVWTARSDSHLWHGDFLVPVEGGISTFFGIRRILNDEKRGRHNGIDIKAPRGTKVLCPNNGRVVMVDEHFFGGRTVVVDHGQGLFSFYMHLDTVGVTTNQEIRKGDVLGTVGSTGRATGPHLHWGVRLNGARVDPLLLMEVTGDDTKATRKARKLKYLGEKPKKKTKKGENLRKR